MKKIIILFIVLTAYYLPAQTNNYKAPQTWTSDKINREEHDSTKDAKRITIVGSAQLDSVLKGQLRQSNDLRNIKLNTDNSYSDPFFVSNIPGYRDTTYTVVIDSNASLSGVINLGYRRVKGIQMPASGWVTANLTFQVSYDNGVTYQTYWVYDVEYSMSATSSVNLNCKPSDWLGISFFKIRSGTAAAPVNQTGNAASRTIKIRAGNY
jgi:hypothetical protein